MLAEIVAEGPISIARYMAICLLDPQYGYYTTRDPLGAGGDFTTSPEISQMFGELIGLWLAQIWLDQGRPGTFTLAELGPGRGTLMADILRATAGVPGFHEAASLWLVEASATLQATQRTTIKALSPNWCDKVADLPDNAPLFVLSNEFFDALPIRQFQKTETGWQERMIGRADGHLAFGLAPATKMSLLEARFADASPGDTAELNSPAEAITADLSATIGAKGGAFLALDYGTWDGTGDTLQALRNHAYDPPLAHPGEADLTSHVAFRWLAEAAPDLRAHFAEQRTFLTALGIEHRATALAKARPDQEAAITSARTRLTDAKEMGRLFKVLALLPPSAALPPGFPA